MAFMQRTSLSKNNIAGEILVRLPSVIIMAISWFLSCKETLPSPGFSNSDKVVHFVCFGGLTFFWTFWFSRKKWISNPIRYFIITVTIVSIYGVVDEIHQSFVPGRECSFFDWLADTTGASAGVLFRLFLIKKIFREKESSGQ